MSDPRSESKSLLPVLQTQSASPQHGQRTASRRRGVRLYAQQSVRRPRALWPQPKIVTRFDPSLRYRPTPAGFAETVSDDFPVLHAHKERCSVWIFAQTGSARDGVEHRYRATVRIPAKGRLRLMKG